MIKNSHSFFSKIFVSCFAGFLAAISALVIFFSLSWAADIREMNVYFVWTIVISVFVTKNIYDRFQLSKSEGHHLILENYKLSGPFLLVLGPIGVFCAVLAHLAGASVGREGSIVQLTAILSDQIKKYFFKLKVERSFVLQQAVAAGFSAALGAPIAGAFMGVELFRGHDDFRERRNNFAFCLLSAVIAKFMSHFIGLQHSQFAQMNLTQFELKWILWLTLSGVAFAAISALYIRVKIFFSEIHHSYVQTNISLVLFAVFMSLFLSQKYFEPYRGLGVSEIQASFLFIKPWYFSFLKILFTLWSLQLLKLKGGEFTPLVFIGAGFGSFLSSIVPLPTALLAALGFVSVYGAVNMVPISMAILAAELFSIEAGVMALITGGVAAYLLSSFAHLKKK